MKKSILVSCFDGLFGQVEAFDTYEQAMATFKEVTGVDYSEFRESDDPVTEVGWDKSYDGTSIYQIELDQNGKIVKKYGIAV